MHPPQWLPIFRQPPQITAVYSRPRNTENSGWKTGKRHIQGFGFPVSNPFSQSLDKNRKFPQCFAKYKHDSCSDTEIPPLPEWKRDPLGKQEHGFSLNYHLFYTCHIKNRFLFKKNMLPIITWEWPLHIDKHFMSRDDKARILLGKEREDKNISELESQENPSSQDKWSLTQYL